MMGMFLVPGAAIQLTGFLERAGGWFAPKEAPPEVRKETGKGKGKSRQIAETGRKAAPKAARSGGTPFRKAVPAAVLATALAAFGGTTLAFSFGQLEYGVGMTEHKFSFAAAEFLRKNPVPGKMFNFFDIGGFLDWQLYPGALTFLDGRTYNSEVFMEHQSVTSAIPGWERTIDKYGINYFVLKAMDSSGMILPIVPALANDPNWSLVFSDGLFLVFVRNTPEFRDYIRLHEVPKGILPQHIIREAYHYMYLGVSPVMAYQTMSNMYMVMGDRTGAIEVLRKAIAETDEPFLRERLRQLEGSGDRNPFGVGR